MTTAAALNEHLERSGIQQIGPFRLERELGKGGFAPVYLASEMYNGVELRKVAVKVFATDGSRSGTRDLGGSREGAQRRARERIVEEARALCRVEHPNIVRFHQIASDPTNTLFALAMEHVVGTSLAERLRTEGRLTPAATFDIGIAVASALAAVHRVGLVHRDVKPANIVEQNGVYKLIDFGIAAFDAPPRKKATKVRVVDDLPLGGDEDASQVTNYTVGDDEGGSELLNAGTLGYMDPAVVADGVPANSASDLYALGATLFECLAGSFPARAAATLRGVGGLRGDVVDGRALAPTLATVIPGSPTGLSELIDRLLQPKREARPQSAERIAAELERLRRVEAGRATELPPEADGPFRGLDRFESRHRDLFFGRTAEVAASLEVLRTRGLLALVGASGSGKSSLARAAVIVAIESGQLGGWPKQWSSVTVTPGRDPRATLGAALTMVPGAASREPDELISLLSAEVERTGKGVVILVDQFEELVTESAPESRDWLAALLARIADRATPGIRAVVAARRDLLDALFDVPELARVLPRGTVVVSSISTDGWMEVIDQGLSLYGYSLESAAMRSDLRTQIAPIATSMPLVQFALRALWERRDRERRVLPAAALAEIGGVAGALEQHAESTVSAIGQLDAVRRVLLALTTARGTRAMLSDEALARAAGPDAPAVRERLEEARLLTREPEGVTLSHEALTSQWKRLSSWLAEARADRALAEEVEAAAAAWAEQQKQEDRLLRRRPLQEAEQLRERAAVALTPLTVEFLTRARAVERRITAVVVTAAVVVVGAAIFGGVSYVANIRERQNETLGALEIVGRTQNDADKLKKHVQTAAEGEVGKLIAVRNQLTKERDGLDSEKKKLTSELSTLSESKKATDARLLEEKAARAKLASDIDALKKSCAK